MSAAQKRAVERRTAKILSADAAQRRGGLAPTSPIPVYFHVMMDRDGNGDVTQEQIDAQIDVLNLTYAGGESEDAAETGFTFALAGVDRFYKNSWHKDKESHQYRRQTRQGGADALNIWLVDFDYLGIATFPWDAEDKGKVDGVRLLYASLPGGTENNYNLGDTATHEVGHWLGLYHTFDGGCKQRGGGDQVEDTPVQGAATNGCPEGQDSCPDLPGLDPIHNYMDYSYDSCYNQFTPGQAVRMNEMWAAYRGA
jgi:hypothetical protein